MCCRTLLTCLLAGLLLPAWPATAAEETLAQWRERREAGLLREDGWPALVALHWLDPEGVTTLGSDAEATVTLASLPPAWGRVARDGGDWVLHLEDAAGVEVDGAPATATRVVLRSDQAAVAGGAPATRVRHGGVRLALIARGDRHALRVWDAQAPGRVGFAGLQYFDERADWRIVGRWQAHQPPRTLDIATVINRVEPMANPGAVVFEHDGRSFRLEAIREEGDEQLFLIFADRTSGRSTYGAGRYLYTALPDADGRVVIDFNRAYNPPCAFTPYATCPLPPPENRLDVAVEAGEQRYRGDHDG